MTQYRTPNPTDQVVFTVVLGLASLAIALARLGKRLMPSTR